ncbi:MAG: LysR family transcriptional regulator, partial [Clostridia bacterium]|nr:LysR family transcriptional regulator [Clostridia bacterium]
MNIEVLANYITVCDSGSINKAARLLHISQPPLSRQIQNLENEL